MRRAAELLFALAALGAWWAMLAPTLLGGPATYIVVRGESMLPTYRNDDLVIVQVRGSYAAGDVVAYRVPAGEVGEGRLVLHRIIGGDGAGGFLVQGDNNPAPDPWRPKLGDVAGLARAQVPAIGRLVALLHQPATAGALAAAMVVGILVGRPPRRRRLEPNEVGSSA